MNYADTMEAKTVHSYRHSTVVFAICACLVLDGCATVKRIVPWGSSESEPAISTTTDTQGSATSTAEADLSRSVEPKSEQPAKREPANAPIDLSVPAVNRDQPAINLDDRPYAPLSKPRTAVESTDSPATNTASNPVAVDDWGRAVQAAIHARWVQPRGPKIPTDFSCDVMVKLTPFGGVDDVKVVRSCGDPALDASIETAVRESSPLPIPKNPDDFSDTLLLTFTPR